MGWGQRGPTTWTPQVTEDLELRTRDPIRERDIWTLGIGGPKDRGWGGQEGKSLINLARVSVVIVIIMKHLKAHTHPGLAGPY